MDHPNIAKVLDAGTTDAGRPFFVMELVRGIRITDYCDQTNLSTRERLNLFIKVCQAIQHAHQKGIIHRDIKPSNILVTLHDGVPVPKVIDFGIAKATEGRLTDVTVYTQLNQFIGTPAYMSPEQAEMSGLDIDTRSDIYALGVLLYELLTGKTPFDAKELVQSGIDAMRKTIREKEPQRPSTRLTQALVAAEGTRRTPGDDDRSASSRRRLQELVGLIRGDLDWIVMKCLEKDRTRRYETANGLAADLKRHLDSEPVIARPPSPGYKFQKAFRRNKLIFSAGTAVLVTMAVGVALSAWQAFRANREARRAQQAEVVAKQRQLEAEAISKFMTEVFQSPDPTRDGRAVTAAEMLGAAVKKLEIDLSDQPAHRAQLQATLATTYFSLGLYSEAIPLREKVRDYYLATFEPDHSNTLSAMYSLGVAYKFGGRRSEAGTQLREVLRLRRQISGPEHPATLAAMDSLAEPESGDPAQQKEAVELLEAALNSCRRVLPPAAPLTLTVMHNLALAYRTIGQPERSLPIQENVLMLCRKSFGNEHPQTIRAIQTMAHYYDESVRGALALELRQEQLRLSRKVFGAEHPNTGESMKYLLYSYQSAGRYEEALRLLEEYLPLMRKSVGPDDPYTLRLLGQEARLRFSVGQVAEAHQLYSETLELHRKVLGPKHPGTLSLMIDIAESAFAVGAREEAMALLAQVRRDGQGTDQGAKAGLMCAVFQVWSASYSEHDASRRLLLSEVPTGNGPVELNVAHCAAKAFSLRPSSSPTLSAQAVAFAERAVKTGINDWKMPWFRQGLGMAHFRAENFAEAERELEEGEGMALKTMSGDSLTNLIVPARMFRSMSVFRQGRKEEARKLFREAEAGMPPYPANELRPVVNRAAVSYDLLIGWLAYKEARALLGELATADWP